MQAERTCATSGIGRPSCGNPAIKHILKNNLIHSCYAPLLPEEHQQRDQRDKC